MGTTNGNELCHCGAKKGHRGRHRLPRLPRNGNGASHGVQPAPQPAPIDYKALIADMEVKHARLGAAIELVKTLYAEKHA